MHPQQLMENIEGKKQQNKASQAKQIVDTSKPKIQQKVQEKLDPKHYEQSQAYYNPYSQPAYNHQECHQNEWYNGFQGYGYRGYGGFRGHRGHHGHHGHYGHNKHHHGHQGYRGYYEGQSSQNQMPQHPQYPPPYYQNQPVDMAHNLPPFQMPPPPFHMPPPPFHMPPPPFHMPPYHMPPPHGCHFRQQMFSRQQQEENKYKCSEENGSRYRKHGGHRGKPWKKWKKMHSRSRSRSSSSSSSSSNDEHIAKKSSIKQKCEKNKNNQQIRKHYQKQMNDFLQSRQVNQPQRQKIVKILAKWYPGYDAPIFDILQYLELIEKEQLTFRMSYVKIIKILIRFNFDLSEAIPKIQKIQHHKIKKYEADRQFNENYGQHEKTPLLEVNDLIILNANNKNIIYLVDGNNILPTNKHFRKYFQSKLVMEKIIAQIRSQWYFSHCFNKQETILFFDEKYEDSNYTKAKKIIFNSQQQEGRFNSISVIYGDGTKADNKIVEKLEELKDDKSQIILVSADRDLNMRCQQIKPILHTSGKYFFKYCKYKINRKYKENKSMKRMVKDISFYRQEFDQYFQ